MIRLASDKLAGLARSEVVATAHKGLSASRQFCSGWTTDLRKRFRGAFWATNCCQLIALNGALAYSKGGLVFGWLNRPRDL